ncbi:flavin-containing monooxygenase [Actinomycetes bacterium M1A6_2h]
MNLDRLRSSLTDADIPVLLMLLVQATGDDRWLKSPYKPARDTRIIADKSGGLSDDIQEQVREAVYDLFAAADGTPELRMPDDDLLIDMMSALVGQQVPRDYLGLIKSSLVGLGMESGAVEVPTSTIDLETVIIGAGVSGVAAGVYLKRAGVQFVILEKSAGVGGTWNDNIYPECGVDTPNHFYSFSFARRPDWPSHFSKQPELLAYVRKCATEFEVSDAIRFGVTVVGSEYHEESQRWTTTYVDAAGVETAVTSRFLISAVGVVNKPKVPTIPGMDEFTGRVVHTARWPAELELAGKRVALVGTGASAVQAARSIAASAEQTYVFQRSPQWIMHNPDYHVPVSEEKKFLLAELPLYIDWYRLGLFWRYGDGVLKTLAVDPTWEYPDRAVNSRNDGFREMLTGYMTSKLADRPDLLEKSLPDYPPFGKRMVVDNEWFETLKRDDVELVAEGVSQFRPDGIVTQSGEFREVDIVVMATGFHTTRFVWPIEITGRGGARLEDVWKSDDPFAYLGISVPRFPNFFILQGPGTALAHGGSAIFQTECQLTQVTKVMAALVENHAGAVEPTESATQHYWDALQEEVAGLVFAHKGMSNWYKNSSGKAVAVSPWRLVDYWNMTRSMDSDAYELEVAHDH